MSKARRWVSLGRSHPSRRGFASIGAVLVLGWVVAACSLLPMGGPTPFPPSAAALPTPDGSTPQVPSPVASPTPIPAPSETPTPACTDTQGRVVDDHYRAHNVAQDVPVEVYLPPCYEFGGGPFPVMILLHGKPFTERHWLDLGVVAAEESRPAGTNAPRWVLVMPRIPEPLFSSTDGGQRSYEDELIRTLLPYIEANYAVRTDPGGRAIAGISRGGVWSLEIGLSHPELFGTVMALSPALAVNHPRPAYDPFTLAGSMDPLPPHVFLGAGDNDWAKPRTLDLVQRLATRGVSPETVWVPGSHAAETWEALIPAVLAYADQSLSPAGEAP